MPALTFHVRHNARPLVIREVLEILLDRPDATVDDILRTGASRKYQVGTVVTSAKSLKENAVQTARDLGLVQPTVLSLTPFGTNMVRLLRDKPKTWAEVMHVLLYTRWGATRYHPSWSYQTLCNILWENGTTSIDRGVLASQVSELAIDRFSTNRVSFSKDSVRGVLQWLAELDPRVVTTDGKLFVRRRFCPPETFVLAVDHLCRLERADYQSNLLLGPEKEEVVCKVCLLEPTAFDAALQWAAGQYPFLQEGATGGWGRHILLTRPPEVRDFWG